MQEAESDTALIAQAQRGSVNAFNALVLRYQTLAYNVALRVLGDAHAAADATQEAFISAFTHLANFRGGSFKHWLLRIVTNACLDILRYQRRRPAISLDQPVDDEESRQTLAEVLPATEDSPEDFTLRRELHGYIARAMQTLPIEQRIVFVLSDVHGLSYEEIAEVMRLSLGTVKSRLSRARAKLRDALLAEKELFADWSRL